MSGWIGVDLDGTLAHYEGWKGETHVGAPIPAMLQRVKDWLAQGREVRIFTARVFEGGGDNKVRDVSVARKVIEDYCLAHLGQVLPVTCVKDYGMVEVWDDRAVRVVVNTGERCCHGGGEGRP